jgi:hypothetical protein
LATSRITLNGPDVQDVVMVILAFEGINNCRVSLRMGIATEGQHSVMVFEAEAWERISQSTEARPLASVRWTAGSTERRTMDALIMQLMYKLDAQMAAGEFSAIFKPIA